MEASVEQLPRGRHGLSREQVLASQRGRLLTAVAEAVAEAGFARVSVAQVIARAGVSRETFYEQFADKEDCFVQALDAGVEALLAILGEALDAPAEGPLEQLDQLLGSYLRALTDAPRFAEAFLIGAFGAGEAAIARRIELQQRFVDLAASILGPAAEADRFACEAFVAATSSLATARIGAGRADELADLRRPLLGLAARLFPALATGRP